MKPLERIRALRRSTSAHRAAGPLQGRAPVDAARAPLQVLIVSVTLLVLGVALAADLVRRPVVVLVGLLVAMSGNALVAAGSLEQGRRPSTRSWWRDVLVLALVTAPLPPALVLGLDLPVGAHAALVGMLVLWAWFALPARLQVPASVLAGSGFVLALLWDGDVPVAEVATHAGGVLLVAIASQRLSSAFTASRDAAVRERASAERRTALLAALGRMHQLEPDEVLAAVGGGLLEVGFDEVVTREIDHRRGVARVLPAASSTGSGEAAELPLTTPMFAEVLQTGRRSLVRDGGDDDEGHVVLLPFSERDEVVVVVAARRVGDLPPGQLEAARSLHDQAATALRRAQAFARDRATVEELRRLDLRSRDFVSTVSHELRTPLTVVQGLGQTMLDRWSDVPDEQRADLLRRIEANADRLASMVSSLLDTSAIESGQLELHRVVVDLASVLGPVVERLGTVAERHPVHLEVDDDEWVDVDPRLLEHVVENLLTNVAKHTPPGTTARVRAVRRGDRVEVAVEDDGPGIPAEDLPHILERFYRAGDPDRRPSGGLGLGLALADEIVRLHGGQLRVESTVGQGSRFSFDVPAAASGARSV